MDLKYFKVNGHVDLKKKQFQSIFGGFMLQKRGMVWKHFDWNRQEVTEKGPIDEYESVLFDLKKLSTMLGVSR